MVDVSHLYFWKMLILLTEFCIYMYTVYIYIDRILELVCWLEVDPSDIGKSLIYLIKYAN